MCNNMEIKKVRKSNEKTVEAKTRNLVLNYGGLFLKWNSPGNSGVSDRIAVLNGRVLFVELKGSGGKIRPLQHFARKQLERRGAECWIVSPENFEEFKAHIKAIADETKE